jgi:hypothetical protein
MKAQDLLNITEATRTKTDTRTSDPFKTAFQDDLDNMGQTPNAPAPRQTVNTPELRRATAELTKQKASQVDMPPEAGQKLGFLDRLGLQDEISDEEAARRSDVTHGEVEPTPPQPTTALANISQEIATERNVEPEWHAVRNLPGYMKNAIRALGRQVFNTFTETPIEDIEVIANLQGSGPNEERELNAVAGWLRENAQRYTDGEMNFRQSIPDYDAEYVMYTAEDRTFLLVQDFAGKYIYSWPTADEKGSERGNLGLRDEVQRRRIS